MRCFDFSLASVLTLRQGAEQAALKTYAEALLARQAAFLHVDWVHRELGANWTQTREAFASRCTAAKIDQLRKHASLLEDELVRRQAALSEAEREVSAALQKMLAARQQRQAIESFRERQRAQYDRELTREGQKSLDEMARRPVASPMAWKVGKSDLT